MSNTAKPEAAKEAPTYLTTCAASKTKTNEAGEPARIVHNYFYNGGKDKNGAPIVSDNGVIGTVTRDRVSINKVNEDGKMLMDGDKIADSVVSFKLSKFVEGFEAGLAAKGLKPGECTITGPRAQELSDAFKGIAAQVEAKKAKSPSP